MKLMTLTDRQVSTIQFSGFFCASVLTFYIAYNFYLWQFRFEPALVRFSAVQLAGVVLFLCTAMLARSYRNTASWLLIITICALCVVLTCLEGLRGGTYKFLLVIGPLVALIFDARRPYMTLFGCALASLLHLALQFVVPFGVDSNQPFLRQLIDPFFNRWELNDTRILYAVDIVFIEFGIGLCAYFAMHWATLAEMALMREFARSEMLLQNLLPSSIASRLKENPKAIIADNFEQISILFADVVNFTPASAAKRPEEVVEFLSQLFGEFDMLAAKYGLEKIKTIGDCYMIAGGMPEKSSGHVQAMADMALDMITAAERHTIAFNDGMSIRIGLHVGPAMAGVIGQVKPYYDVWGDTINVASRIESTSVPGRIQITEEVRKILGVRYRFENRGLVDIKGKGPMNLFFLTGRPRAKSDK